MTCKQESTHHNACDCREDYFKKLEEKIKRYEEALKFYAQTNHIKEKCPIDSETEEIEPRSDRWEEMISWEFCGDMYSGQFCENGRIAKEALEQE